MAASAWNRKRNFSFFTVARHNNEFPSKSSLWNVPLHNIYQTCRESKNNNCILILSSSLKIVEIETRQITIILPFPTNQGKIKKHQNYILSTESCSAIVHMQKFFLSLSIPFIKKFPAALSRTFLSSFWSILLKLSFSVLSRLSLPSFPLHYFFFFSL